MFFDLERDPLELQNLFGKAAYQDEISVMTDELARWRLFNESVTNHLDRNAPQCSAANVPDGDTGLYSHFKSIMNRNANKPIEATLDSAPDGWRSAKKEEIDRGWMNADWGTDSTSRVEREPRDERLAPMTADRPPPRRTGHADFPHPALAEGIC